jgi:PAS domain S-box-containing protein
VVDLSKYELEALRPDGDLILYRGSSKADQTQLLVLSPVGQFPSPESLKRLDNEFCLNAELDSSWAARPLGVVSHWDRTVLVLQDPGGVPLNKLLAPKADAANAESLDIALALRLAISISAAIGALHQRGIIHKDIKPANVLVNSATGQCWLTGFGIASRLPRERQPPGPPEFIAGTLPYMAPEQTGRMNRSIDSRSDLYALGVTLYEMLTGSLPFSASDPMEWVHCHIARQPVPPDTRSASVPAPVSAIVMKLLAKTAEERYQTAAGLESDLRRCLVELEGSGPIAPFPLGEHDTPDRLLIPEKLYGRAREIDTLLASFDRVVANGRPELVLVSGYSGIGKSSVVNELHKVLVPPRGLFASGKFDQYKQNIPYSTLAQAFQSLVRPLLAKTEAELHDWREALLEALGPNGPLMVDLVPEVKLIIGEQPAVADLPPQEAKARFQLVFRRFVGVFARPEHPLALFLDDLQWLDAATLDFLQDLLTQPDVHHLMLIGAYRDNEIGSAHPLCRKLDAIRRTGALVQEITLAPLTQEDLERLIADSLRCAPHGTVLLARLVHHKTGGNPFFAIQFISALAEEGLLTFDHGAAQWSWDLARIHGKGYTDNIADLMVGKLNRLPVSTQNILKEFACLGNSAEVTTLSIVHGASEPEIHSDLWEALRLEFIMYLDGSYQFVHDRVREAAYSLVPERLRAEAHLRIGRLLAANIPSEKENEAIFEIVNQLNRGIALITLTEERERVARLNLNAARRAKMSTAYASALLYLTIAGQLLEAEGWDDCYNLAFAIELNRAECEFLTGQLAMAEARLSKLSSGADNLVDMAAAIRLQVVLYTTLNRPDRAIQICFQFLRRVGITWSPNPTGEDLRQEFEEMRHQLDGRPAEALLDSPLMSDPDWLATMDVLTEILPSAFFTDRNLLSLVVMRMVNLSIEHGNSDASCLAYAFLSMVLRSRFADYDSGFRWGQVSLDLMEKKGLKRFKARVYLCFGNIVTPWVRHLHTARAMVRHGLETALATGDLTYSAYSYSSLVSNLLASGDRLEDVQHEAERGFNFVAKAGFDMTVNFITVQLNFIKTLRGLTPVFGSFGDDGFEDYFERQLENNPQLTLSSCWYWIRRLQGHYYSGQYGLAVAAAVKAEKLLWTTTSFLEEAEYHFFAALAIAAIYDSELSSQRPLHLKALADHSEQITLWAQKCPENFADRAALVCAEIAHIGGREWEAARLYEQAIRLAQTNGFLHHEALANELAARFYRVTGFEKIANGYLRDARYCYHRWGAAGKVRQLDQLYPHLIEKRPALGPTSTIGAPIDELDFTTVVEALRALSSEIVLEKLIDTLMRRAIEHAGAERGLLILARDEDQRIEAEATTSGDTIVVRLKEAPVTADTVPESIIRYVARTHDSVILDDASALHPFSTDSYLRQQHARSILCLPLISQTKLIGLLYLENNLTPHVFTRTRIAALKLLASQAAISLENTHLYRDLEEREAKIRRLVDANIMGIYIWNLQGEILKANEAFLHILGYSREDLVSGGLRWTDLTPPEWRGRDAEAQAELIATGAIQPFEKEYFRKDGIRVPVLMGCANFDGRGNEGVAFVLDLSEQKRAEDERKRAEEALHQAQVELGRVSKMTTMEQLAASIAHEVNQPLAAVVASGNACLNWLSATPPNLRKAREAVERMVRDGNRASDVLKRVRALLRKAPLVKSPVNVNEVIQEVLALVGGELRKQSVELSTELDLNLPSVTADFVQLQQVLLNLVMNAIESMAAKPDRPRLLHIQSCLEDRAERSTVLVAVRDSGVGLTAVEIVQVFEAFYSTKPEGMGMGLWICRSIIEAHGGQLTARPNDGGGATFQFVLPSSTEDGA